MKTYRKLTLLVAGTAALMLLVSGGCARHTSRMNTETTTYVDGKTYAR